MIKKYAFLFFLIIGAGLFFVLSTGDREEKKEEVLSPLSQETRRENIKIHYQENKRLSKKESEHTKAPDKTDKNVVFYTQDINKRYDIFIVNEANKHKEITAGTKYKNIKGSIRNSNFILKIPVDMVENETTTIVFIDRETNKTYEINGSFLGQVPLLEPNERMLLKVDFDTERKIDVEIEEKKSTLPIPLDQM